MGDALNVSATVDGVTIESSSGTAEELAASLAPAPPEGTAPAPDAETAKPKETAGDVPAATSDAADPDPASEAGKQLSKRRRDMQSAIDRATWEKHEALREADKLKAELAALKDPKPAAASTADARPKLKTFTDRIGTDFDTYEDAVDAHADALTDYKLAARDTASVAAQQTHVRQQALHQTYTRGVDAHADFDAVLGQFVEQGGRLAPSTPQEAAGPLGDLEAVILTHPQGHSVAYEVSKDPALYQRLLGSQTRVMFMAELGKLLTRLDGAPTGSPSTPAPVSKAKPPVKPVGGQPQATGGPPGDDASDEEHLRYWNQQEIASRRRA